MSWYKEQELPKIKQVKNEIKLNFKFLKEILLMQSPSKSILQDNFRDWLKDYVEKIPNVSTKIDRYGNLYVTKGKSDIYPCIVAHLDTAQSFHEKMYIFQLGNLIYGFDTATGEQCGIGADDKVGIYIALEMLKRFDNIKCFFPLDEEVGCIGSSQCNLEFFDNCSFLAQPDRRSYTTDFITKTNGIEVCSKDFYNLFNNLMSKYGYSINTGTCTDIGNLKRNQEITCPAFNYSCGYINEHMNNEVILVDAMENAINFLYELIKQEGYKKHTHIVETSVYLPKKYPKIISDRTFECEHYSFSGEMDEEWIDNSLEIGQCPYCTSSVNEKYENGELFYHCEGCNSKWDITPLSEDEIAYFEEEDFY